MAGFECITAPIRPSPICIHASTAAARQPRRQRPWVPRVEAWMESALSAAQRGLSRTPRNHWETVLRIPDRPGAQKEFHPVLLEEHSRMAALVVALLFYFCRRSAERFLWRFAGTRQSVGLVAGLPPDWRVPANRQRKRSALR